MLKQVSATTLEMLLLGTVKSLWRLFSRDWNADQDFNPGAVVIMKLEKEVHTLFLSAKRMIWTSRFTFRLKFLIDRALSLNMFCSALMATSSQVQAVYYL